MVNSELVLNLDIQLLEQNLIESDTKLIDSEVCIYTLIYTLGV